MRLKRPPSFVPSAGAVESKLNFCSSTPSHSSLSPKPLSGGRRGHVPWDGLEQQQQQQQQQQGLGGSAARTGCLLETAPADILLAYPDSADSAPRGECAVSDEEAPGHRGPPKATFTSSSSSVSSSTPSSSSSASPSSPGSPIEGGIVNPNYPGFEHLAAKLLKLAAGSDCDDDDDDDDAENNNNNNNITAKCNNKNKSVINNRNIINNNINNFGSVDEDDSKIDPVNRDLTDWKNFLYEKPKLCATMADAMLSSAKEDLTISRDLLASKHAKVTTTTRSPAKTRLQQQAPALNVSGSFKDSNRAQEEMEEEEEKYNKESTEKELRDGDLIVPRKKEKVSMSQPARKGRAGAPFPGADRADRLDKRYFPATAGRREKRSSLEALGGFDVYNIETAMPRIDLDLIESHLRAAKEEERRRRNDREEIRRRLAMGSEDGDYYGNDQRPGKKPSLQSRLQSGMNLQICFMNETLSDTESPGSEGEVLTSGAAGPPVSSKSVSTASKVEPVFDRLHGGGVTSKPARPLSLPLRLDAGQEWRDHTSLMTEADFLARQAQLQTEARMALAQAKDMAHMQMEIDRQKQNASPITEMVRMTLKKVGVSFPDDRRRLSRQILTEMNVAQLQVIVNDLHSQIEYLNESLVHFLMERDDLHMEQDSMLVDIEDLTRYLGAKDPCNKGVPSQHNVLIKANGSSEKGRTNVKK